MRMSDAFPSNFLRAADFPKPTLLTMSYVKMEEIGDDNKPALYFKELEKALILNKTNANTISEAYGDDTDAWEGHPLVLFEASVQFQGRMVAAIRVRKPKPQAVTLSTASKPALRQRENTADDMDDLIPF